MAEARQEGQEGLPDGFQTGGRECAHAGAVVGVGPADDAGLGGPAIGPVVLAGELDSRFVRLGARTDEEHGVQVAGRQVGDQRGGLESDGGGGRPGGEEGELFGLLAHRLRDVGPAVPDLHHEQPGQGVEVLVARVVPEVTALATGEDGDGSRAPVLGAGEGGQEVAQIMRVRHTRKSTCPPGLGRVKCRSAGR